MSMLQHPPEPVGHTSEIIGKWVVAVHRIGHGIQNISTFRGAPTKIGDMSFSDPFGPKQLTLTLPHVTYLEQRGTGDLWWMYRGANVTVVWEGEIPARYPHGELASDGSLTPGFRWEGYIASIDYEDGVVLQAKGAMYQLDDYLAKPEYLTRPLPYEQAIARQFRNRTSLRLSSMRIEWPSWWGRKYRASSNASAYMIPSGVSDGANWTALLTRDTGKWDPVLTSYIQTMLTSMYTHRGRFSLELRSYRRPALIHRDDAYVGSNDLVVVDPIVPGVKLSFSEDFDQAVTTVFGQGTSLSGVSYTGMETTPGGQRTYYEPMAALRQAYPEDDSNQWYTREEMPKEIMLQAQQGLDYVQAASMARAHLSKFSDPGITGTLTLTSDPTFNGKPILRHLVRAGMKVQIKNLFGEPEGIVVHITDSASSLENDSVTLTFDSKARDALTASEVRLRGRDALNVPRMLVGGSYQPPVPDQLYPWHYSGGSGYIPSNDLYSSVRLFRGMPKDVRFPWTSWTKSRPPRWSKYRSCYLRLSPAGRDANKNWLTQKSQWGAAVAVPIKMSQAATIRLVQIAAYKEDGSIYRVPFHVSLYYFGSVNYKSMPIIPADDPLMDPPRNYGYAKGQQHHPFVKGGWEQYNEDGTLTNPAIVNAAAGAGLVRVWGTREEKAGYWPGSYSGGGNPTGLLVDETQWSYDLSGVGDAVFDPYDLERNLKNSHSGQLYMMIFCEDNDEDVYFMGRMFRVEPGGE